MNVLVTGGAGYVGSVAVEELIKQGDTAIVFDNLVQGYRDAVAPEAIFVEGDLADSATLDEVFRRHPLDAVMHFAGETLVGESMTNPYRYFLKNIVYGLNLLEVMRRHKVNRFIFSSTSAVYGEPETLPITESHPQRPINAYGESKAIFERILRWYHNAYGLKFGALRYFNACGASERFGEEHCPETHLIPLVLQVALGRGECIQIFGTDYETRDGTCIRDFTHVVDIAQAHLLVLKNLDVLGCRFYNLGNGNGYTVLEVVQTAREVTGAEIPAFPAPRRLGDPTQLVASSELIKSELGWSPKHPQLRTIIETAWNWHRKYPEGYRE